ncbi:MAG: recombination regulator RecX [Bacteroidales bacterium]|nr:recombination regulator RecX [Lachnoclostridium sp.]MCM1383325.1 recombination regulator RecX [Lachnoclostridium sp.]MCM1464989.1 recombination regulator RecX [Bacteroidales bacterium]
MIVTQIVELSKTRSKVYIEQEPAFVLYKGELRLYHVCEGEELSEEDYNRILSEVLPKRAKLRAMNLLKSREYTREELRRKLEQGHYPRQIIEIALAYVESYGYIDDLRYAVSYITYHETDKSRRQIEQHLMQKGISKGTLEKAWQEWEEKGGRLDERAMIEKLLQKRHYTGETADRKEQQRIYAFLARKGFSGEAILSAMNCTQ